MDDKLRSLLGLIVLQSSPNFTDEEGEWFTIVPNDPDELGHPRSPVGIMVKIAGDTRRGTSLHVVDITTYNR